MMTPDKLDKWFRDDYEEWVGQHVDEHIFEAITTGKLPLSVPPLEYKKHVYTRVLLEQLGWSDGKPYWEGSADIMLVFEREKLKSDWVIIPESWDKLEVIKVPLFRVAVSTKRTTQVIKIKSYLL